MSAEHLYLVTYDVSDSKRLRRVFRILEGYGEWVQLSVFQCRLSELRKRRLLNELELEIKQHEDHVLLFKLGRADSKYTEFVSLGRTFEPVTREPIII
ncbi:CRISPR-associated endonuclease Cas2 [Marinobacterium sp. D7]|uniref:CRISPR-associated endonuclease Cas2 n=1 Tax=Marinobacterium ramblicola TaxID=2849041 RepID=UPI001C2DCA0D|nr:CRISPR-associated endonuclease Cas2 [Marinobacterium ramblicola]